MRSPDACTAADARSRRNLGTMGSTRPESAYSPARDGKRRTAVTHRPAYPDERRGPHQPIKGLCRAMSWADPFAWRGA